MPRAPKRGVYLDTNVPSWLERLQCNHNTFREILSYYTVYTSPLSIVETIADISTSNSEQYFKADRIKLSLLCGSWQLWVLEFPWPFAAFRVLSLKPSSLIRPIDFKRWIKVINAAESQRNLINLEVVHPERKGLQFGFDSSILKRQQDQGKLSYRTSLKSSTESNIPSVAEWVKYNGSGFGATLTDTQINSIGSRLMAAYAYFHEKMKEAAAPQFNSDKHDGDWIDTEQLLYLCDSNLLFVTAELKIRETCERSQFNDAAQSKRIITLSEFLRVKHPIIVDE